MNIPTPNTDRLVKTFLDLVQIDSPSKQEADVAAYIEKALAPLGVECRRDDAGAMIGGNCGNLYVRMAARKSSAPGVLFSAHMDCVMPCIGVKPVVDNGVVRSDGSTVLGSDDKSGIATIMEMLRCLHESDMPHGTVEAVFDVAEEIGLLGANYVELNKVSAKCAFILDSEELDRVVYRAPSANRMHYEIDGVAAHAGMAPEKGVSAIEVFAEAVSHMKLGRLDPDSTANIGTVNSGRATNIVADKLTSTAEARSHSNEILEEQTRHMTQCFESAIKKFTKTVDGKLVKPVFRADVKREFTAMNIPLASPAYKLAADAGKALGLDMQPMSIGGGTNANVYNAKGMPAVVIGCGMMDEHTNTEHVRIADMEMSVKLCLAIVRNNHESTR
jgi:tripeptide aminopeptidase